MPPVSQQEPSFLEADYLTISRQCRSLFSVGFFLMLLLAGWGALDLFLDHTEFFFPYLMITGPALWGFWYWTKRKFIGLPILPIFLTQQTIVYTLPIFHYSKGIEPHYQDVFSTACATTGIFFLCLIAGWRGLMTRGERKPSRLDLNLGEGKDAEKKSIGLSFMLLGAAFIFHLSSRSGFIYDVLPNSLHGLMPIMRTFASAGAMLGALLGGIVISNVPGVSYKFMYWGLILLISFLSMADVLISAASSIVLSSIVGISLGTRKPPVILLLITMALVSFLNQGKTDLRLRYWVPGTLATDLSVFELPGFYLDWFETSEQAMFVSEDKNAIAVEEGLSIFERINNLQNSLYIIDVMTRKQLPALGGKTYAIIPPLFVPRALWPDKPRAHQGQAILNVDFERQRDEEETYKVYIAWGLLPEAIANFGVWAGPVVLGLVMGMGIGWLERISLHKRILSVEGMTLGGLLLITAGSYEMVASVYLTSTFQFLVAVTLAGTILYYAFRKDPNQVSRKLRKY